MASGNKSYEDDLEDYVYPSYPSDSKGDDEDVYDDIAEPEPTNRVSQAPIERMKMSEPVRQNENLEKKYTIITWEKIVCLVATIIIVIVMSVGGLGAFYVYYDNRSSQQEATASNDKENPLINACPADLEMPTDPGNPTAVVTYQVPHATDNSGEVTVTCAPTSESEFAIGPTNVVCTAQDGSENRVTCEFTVDVKDEEDPVIGACPADIEVEKYPARPNCTVVVTYQVPHATDNSGEVTVTCASPSESEFTIGTNVVCTAQDGSENRISCEFTVDVKCKGCNDRLGMENGDIPDENIQASSYASAWDTPGDTHEAKYARLNSNNCWWADYNDVEPWIQVDIGYQTYVSGVITQGDGGSGGGDDRVTKFKVSTFLDATDQDDETFVLNQNGEEKVFQGNSDAYSEVTRTFQPVVYARIVRITCIESLRGWNQLRFEILGCKQAQ